MITQFSRPMTLRTLLLVAVCWLSGSTHLMAQQSIALNELKAKYGSFIIAHKKQAFTDRIYIDKEVVIPQQDSLLAGFVTQYKSMIEIWHTNYTTIAADDLKSYRDSAKVQRAYINMLQADELFNRYCLPYMAHYYQSRGVQVIGFEATKPTYTFDEVMDVVAKYFEIVSVDSRGQFKARMGIGEEGLVRTLPQRAPLLEVFCLHLIKTDSYTAYKAMNSGLKVIHRLQLGLIESEQKLRAEGILFAAVSQDAGLRDAMKKAIQDAGTALPFSVTELE